MKLTRRKAKYFLKDERHAAKVYDKYGFHELAEDEREHANYFTRRMKKMPPTKRRKRISPAAKVLRILRR